MEGVPSPYVIDFDSYKDSFDTYDDLPATASWMQTIGAALGKKFNIRVTSGNEQWEIDFDKKEARAGSIDNIFTRRGVLGLLLNGVGRLAFGMGFPPKEKAIPFAQKYGVDAKLAQHFGALAKVIDEIRTDDVIAHEYAGGERVVDTMHAQAYEAANQALRAMAVDMRRRKAQTREYLEWMEELMALVEAVAQEKSSLMINERSLLEKRDAVMAEGRILVNTEVENTISPLERAVSGPVVDVVNGRMLAAILIAAYPSKSSDITKVLVRTYTRNIALLSSYVSFAQTTKEEEEQVIAAGLAAESIVADMRAFAGQVGGHAQYVLAKAEQYYHAYSLGISMVSPYAGYDIEAKALEVVEANEAASQLAQEMWDRGVTKDVDDSLDFSKSLLPLIERFPFLDLNEHNDEENQNSMGRRAAGAGSGSRPKKRSKEREKKSQSDRAKDRKKMEALDNEKNQKEVDEKRGGYSILGKSGIDPLKRYLYIIGPYLSRIATTTARIRRLLRVNDPRGLRGAYNRGKKLNPRILYRHRLDDFRLFARREVEKDQSYGFAVMGDLSGSTDSQYSNSSNRQVCDEILASAFILAEVAERIGEKVMCSVGFFDSGAETIKRAGKYLSRSTIVTDIKNHGGGTNVEAAGEALNEDLQEMADFKIKKKTIVFITDGSFPPHEFIETVKAAKKHKASIAYFQISGNAAGGVDMCKKIEKFTAENAKGVRVRTRSIPTSAINTLPEAMAQLLKETIGVGDR